MCSCGHPATPVVAPRQFFYLNGRPIDFPRAAKVVNEAFRAQTSPLGSTAAHKPAAILDIVVGRGAVDVNVTPDKRKARECY